MKLESLKIGMAFKLLMRTMPILLIRLGATFAFWVVALIYLAITIGVATLVGKAVPILGFIVGLVAVIGVVPMYQLAYKYVFFMIKAAHIAVISEILVNDKLPDGAGGQLEWGRQRVTERFGEMNVMFVVDELVNGVVRAFTRTVYSVTMFLPGDTLRQMVGVVNRVIRISMGYIDEAVLARSFYNPTDNVWGNARDGVVLYAQVWKPMLTNAVALMLISILPGIAAFVIFALPLGLIISAIFGEAAGGWSIIALFLFAYLVKVAIGDAFAITAMIAAYQRETKDLTPNPEMTSQLEGLSDQFRELTEKAKTGLQERMNQPSDTPSTTPDAPASPPASSAPPASSTPSTPAGDSSTLEPIDTDNTG